MKRILEGLLIGIGKIIPGVSGSVIAISLGVYEHAINSGVTLAQSQNYTLGHAGLGGVFVYPYNISAKYDGMSGLQMDF